MNSPHRTKQCAAIFTTMAITPEIETKCPSCQRVLLEGEQIYRCEVCGKECCTACTDTTGTNAVICDDCDPKPTEEPK